MNKDFFKSAFGKEKDTKTHARVMLGIYAVFIIIVIIMLRTGNSNNQNNQTNNTNNVNTNEVNNNTNKEDDDNTTTVKKKKRTSDFDINYSYSYKVEYDNQVETYLGKKVDDKEMFSYIKGNTTLDYAIYNDTYLLKKDGEYHITDALNNSFKYCDIEKIISIIEEKEYKEEGNIFHYEIKNVVLAKTFDDKLSNWDNDVNKIDVIVENDTLKTIKLDFSNYISAKENANHKLIITMEFANVGTTEDFELKIN